MAALSSVAQAEQPFLQEHAAHYTTENGLRAGAVLQILVEDDASVIAETTDGWSRFSEGEWNDIPLPGDDTIQPRAELEQLAIRYIRTYYGNGEEHTEPETIIHQVKLWGDATLLVASSRGAFRIDTTDGTVVPEVIEDSLGRQWGRHGARCIAYDGSGWWIGTRAGAAHRGKQTDIYTGANGLPYADFTCAAAGDDGSVWFGTTKGVVRFKDGEWTYRQGPRWLPNDHVTDIAIDKDGSAWIATKAGIAHIRYTPTTFAQKAAHYEEDIPLIKRTPYGYTAEVHLGAPGDRSEIIHSDSDNDGLWTAMYGAGECFAYAATGDPGAKERAKQAFEALRFLQKVTQGGEHGAPKGFVARTILPTDGRDPNIGRIAHDQREHDKGDTLWKVYEPRWPKSADGKWYWKSDTSSDELDGHYFFYPAYYDLVADTEVEKERVREVVRDLTDHLIDHGFRLVDHTGTVTRWGAYNPEALNGDVQWWVERGLNSLSMLSYLAVAEHVTGDPKYGKASRLLIDEHHYDQNAMTPKMQFGIGSGNQSDDEMAVMSFYNLIKYTKDEKLRQQMRYSFFNFWKLEQPEMNPFFNFAYAASCLGATYSNQWGTVDLNPWDDWLEDSLRTLRGFPLDRLNWPIQNSHRLDIVTLPHQNARDPDDPAPPRRGWRTNGKVLPVEERHFNHWNTDPWALDYGGDGRTLANGTVFLLPYYLGLYHGFIE